MPELPKILMSDKAVIIGHSGSGKTYLLKYLLKNQLNTLSPMFIIDSANQLSRVPYYNYVGKTDCNYKRANQFCYKFHTGYQLEAFISYLQHNKKQFFMVIDEVDRYTSPLTIEPETKLWLEEGRNFNRGGIFTVRRVGFLNKSILSNSRYLYLFKINNKSDRIYLSTILDMDISSLIYHNEHSFYVFDLYNTKMIGEFIV